MGCFTHSLTKSVNSRAIFVQQCLCGCRERQRRASNSCIKHTAVKSYALNSDGIHQYIILTCQLSPAEHARRICTSKRKSRAWHRENANIAARLSPRIECLCPFVVPVRPTKVAIFSMTPQEFGRVEASHVSSSPSSRQGSFQ